MGRPGPAWQDQSLKETEAWKPAEPPRSSDRSLLPVEFGVGPKAAALSKLSESQLTVAMGQKSLQRSNFPATINARSGWAPPAVEISHPGASAAIGTRAQYLKRVAILLEFGERFFNPTRLSCFYRIPLPWSVEVVPVLRSARGLDKSAPGQIHTQIGTASVVSNRLPRHASGVPAMERLPLGSLRSPARIPKRSSIYPNVSAQAGLRRVATSARLTTGDGSSDARPPIPFSARTRTFGYGLWAEVGERDFHTHWDNFELVRAKLLGPFEGRLGNRLPDIADTNLLRCRIHLSDEGQRPSIEVVPCDHPFYLEQQNGLTIERAIYLARLVPGFEIIFDA